MLLVGCGHLLMAQALIDSTIVESSIMRDSIFGQLDMAPVTSGIFMDRGMHIIPYSGYSGNQNADTLSTFSDLMKLYLGMSTSAIDTAFALSHPDNWRQQVQEKAATGTIPIVVVDYEYQRFLTDSTQLWNLIELDGVQLKNISGQTQSPFETHSCVAAYCFLPKKPSINLNNQNNQGFLVLA